MRKVVLYIAMSLDGYIADEDGGVEWLSGDGSDLENPGSYGDFIETVDTVIMGYRTYAQVTEELAPGQWPYGGKKCYVITHHAGEPSEEISFTGENLPDLVSRLKREEGKDIWICGGSSVIRQLLEADMIDRFWITVIPAVLGSGVFLFPENGRKMELKLISFRSYNGMTDLVYERRHGRQEEPKGPADSAS